MYCHCHFKLLFIRLYVCLSRREQNRFVAGNWHISKTGFLIFAQAVVLGRGLHIFHNETEKHLPFVAGTGLWRFLY